MISVYPLDVDYVKRHLQQTHSSDDQLLDEKLGSAIQEALRFMNRSQLPTLPLEYVGSSSSEEVPSSEDPVTPDVCSAVVLLVQADYDGDPEKRASYRSAAETLLQPYRTGIGV